MEKSKRGYEKVVTFNRLEENDYDFKNDKTGEQITGTTKRIIFKDSLSEPMIKVKNDLLWKNLNKLGLKYGDKCKIIFDISIDKQGYIDNIILIDIEKVD